MIAALSFSDTLTEFLVRARLLSAEEEPPVPADDPTRDPDWCWAHNKMWPACADEH